MNPPSAPQRLALALSIPLLLVAACGGTDGPSATSSADTDVPATTAAPPTTTAASDPRCGVATLIGFDDVACAEPHDAEFVGLVAAPATADVEGEQFDGAASVAVCAALVEAFVGRPLSSFGVDVGHVAVEGEQVECWAEPPTRGLLVASIAEVGLEAALGDAVLLADLDPSTCFSYAADDDFSLGYITDCSTFQAEMMLGVVESDLDGWPGDDEVLDEFSDLCADLLAATSTETLPEVSFIYGSEEEWEVYGRRSAICTTYRPEDFDGSAEGDDDPFVSPATYVPGVDAPICLQNIEEDDSAPQLWLQVECSVPHNAELTAVVELPEGALPADYDEAVLRLAELCAPSVQNYVGAEYAGFGVFVSTRVTGSLGQPVTSPVDCIASVPEPVLVGSFQEAALPDLLGDVKVLTSLSVGTCFQFVGDATSLVTIADCSDEGALLFVGTYQMAERDVYPDVEVLRAERRTECERVLAASGLSGDPVTLSGTFVGRDSYVVLGARTATCDVAPM